MFILTKNKDALAVLKAYKQEFENSTFDFGDIFTFRLNNYFLFWFSARPQDQLFVYQNGFIIGKKDFETNYSDIPVEIHEKLPENTSSLLQSTTIEVFKDQVNIIPNEITSIYYDEDNVSDFTLLLAKLLKRLPDDKLIQIFSGIGYMPGNLTIFKNILKIPYLRGLKLNSGKLFVTDKFIYKKGDDDKMVSRLIDIVPKTSKQQLAMSGGLDSRFVLGVLLKAKIRPKLVTLLDKESTIVEKVSHSLNLLLEKKNGEKEGAYQYTLMTDARIYYKGGNYSKMFENVKHNHFLHTGLSILPMNENSFATAWKKPGSIKNIYNDLIRYALLPRVPSEGFSVFEKNLSKQEMQNYLEAELVFGKEYLDFKTRKQWALWFYHLNRGLTWTIAHLQDASFYIYPIFLLGDKKAAEYGIASSAYSNFNKERLRKINQKLFPDLPIDYSDYRTFESKPFLLNHWSRIYNEFFKKMVNRFVQLNSDKKTDAKTDYFKGLSLEQSKNIRKYYKKDLRVLLKDKTHALRVRRTAVTINNALLFLEK